MNDMRTTVNTIFILLLIFCGQSRALELSDTQNIIVEVDSVSLYCDSDLQVQFTYRHKGIFSTLGYSLSVEDLEVIATKDFVSPVKADIPQKISDQVVIPNEWMRHEKIPIIFKIYFTLYNQDSFESAEIVGMYTYIDTIEVILAE